MYIQRRRIVANDEIIDDVATEEMMDMDEEVIVEPEASDLLFEAEDVAQLVAEVTGDAVEVTADEGVVTFAVGEDEFVVEAEGDEEVLESVRVRKTPVKSSARSARAAKSKRPVKSSTKAVRKVPSTKRK